MWYVSTDIDDDEPLTPVNLLYGLRIKSVLYQRIEIEIIDGPHVMNTSYASERAHRLSFIIEYITALKKFHKKSWDNNISIQGGDIVEFHEDQPRNRWKIAIVELFVGNDRLIRSAIIRTNSASRLARSSNFIFYRSIDRSYQIRQMTRIKSAYALCVQKVTWKLGQILRHYFFVWFSNRDTDCSFSILS